MSPVTLGYDPARRSALVERVRGILLTPSAEWDRIAHESTPIPQLFTGYAMILAAIGPVCGAVAGMAFGGTVIRMGDVTISDHPSLARVLSGAIVSYALALGSAFVMGLVIEYLAPRFGGVADRTQAMKVAVYGSTAAWLAGVFRILPGLGILAVVGLYSFYLVYRGLPRLMRCPQDKALVYMLAAFVVEIVLTVLALAVLTPLHLLGV